MTSGSFRSKLALKTRSHASSEWATRTIIKKRCRTDPQVRCQQRKQGWSTVVDCAIDPQPAPKTAVRNAKHQTPPPASERERSVLMVSKVIFGWFVVGSSSLSSFHPIEGCSKLCQGFHGKLGGGLGPDFFFILFIFPPSLMRPGHLIMRKWVKVVVGSAGGLAKLYLVWHSCALPSTELVELEWKWK